MNIIKLIKKSIKWLLCLAIVGIITLLSINYYVVYKGDSYKITLESDTKADAVIVLGARVFSNGTLSDMLEDRMNVGIQAVKNNMSNKLLVSGDHGRKEYDEVNSMKDYALGKGLKPEDVFMDHAGFSTYETMYRAKEIFGVKKAIIITQDYHLKRAIYIARRLGIEAYGIPSDEHTYPMMLKYETREKLARIKDFIYVNFLKPKPTYLGEAIPITGDGRLTYDKEPKD